MIKKIFGISPTKATIHASQIIGPNGGLSPDHALPLVEAVRNGAKRADRIVLDFSGAGTLNSAFANAFFLGLSETMPLSEWRKVIEFKNLNSHQYEILQKSLQAVRNATSGAPKDGRSNKTNPI